ncbi:Rossmann-fold NAD(P)-binding domain-containing protein [Pontibacter oryzae]|uniref:N-succinylornithine carbamoyltransferase n=1 Tax=Pontibacter oryzae TaxID=2304593 RepID=A0A399SCF8_9BACT|nr:acetylornithine carbamoyltransferase [Pontibacter oryzae]RIJ41756.1 acetylornithine carbamoyltransferase [Pontibacter oryzae]
MKKFTAVQDVANVDALVQEALYLKSNPFKYKHFGENKTLGLIFLNPSLRTRLSTQKAAINLGMNVIVMNLDKEGWALETQEGAIMNGSTVEHIKEAAAVMGEYCDIIGIRSFPKLQNREEDYSEELLQQFIDFSKTPIVSLESATRHPLQSLADMLTITENVPAGKKPKVVLSWAPHIKPIPQCVANSFAEWMGQADVELVITHPEGYELAEEFTKGATITTNQQEALEGADFVYVKNWSSYTQYGQVLTAGEGWMLTEEKLQATNSAKVMHCLPVRRNVELSDEILDGPNSLVLAQANNRTYAAQAVLKRMLEAL